MPSSAILKQKGENGMNGMDCESCVFYVYDDEAEGYFCEAEFDMDEMERLLSHPRYQCPYYQNNDDYCIVRKQN